MRKVRIKALPKAKSGYSVETSAKMFNGIQQNWPTQMNQFSQPDTKANTTLQPVPRHLANLEAEKGEEAVVNQGGIPAKFKIGGKRHSEGGTPLNLPENSFIFSDTKAMRIKDPQILAQFGYSSGVHTPAEIAKKYDVNKYRAILADPDSSKLDRDTAEMMIANYNLKLAKLALVQESKKGFPQGIPAIAMPYIQTMEIDPSQFLATQSEQTPFNPDMGTAKFGGALPMAQRGLELPKREHSFGNPVIDKQYDELVAHPDDAKIQAFFNKAQNVSNVDQDYIDKLYFKYDRIIKPGVERDKIHANELEKRKALALKQVVKDKWLAIQSGASDAEIKEIEKRAQNISKLKFDDYIKNVYKTADDRKAFSMLLEKEAPMTYKRVDEKDIIKKAEFNKGYQEAANLEEGIGKLYSKVYKQRQHMNEHPDQYTAEDFEKVNSQFHAVNYALDYANKLQKDRKKATFDKGLPDYSVLSQMHNLNTRRWSETPLTAKVYEPAPKVPATGTGTTPTVTPAPPNYTVSSKDFEKTQTNQPKVLTEKDMESMTDAELEAIINSK